MSFVINSKIFEKFPGVHIGAVVAKGIDNSGTSDEIENMLREQGEAVKSKFNLETLAQESKINAWREADRTKLTEATKNVILVLEGLPPVTKEQTESATRELKELIEEYCGNVIYSVLSESNKEIEI